jgi:tRNA modification GTPase
MAGWQPRSAGEGIFMARQRHLDALIGTWKHLENASVLVGGDASARNEIPFDLLAEELRLAQRALSSITGEFTADDLLGEIFFRFCIGK